MTRSHLDGNPFAPDSRYPNLFVGSRVTKFPPHEPELGGKVIKYDFGAGCPWVVEWDREVRFKPPNWEHVYRSRLAPSVSRIHVHLGEELQHEHTCIICEHGGYQVDQTHACMCRGRMRVGRVEDTVKLKPQTERKAAVRRRECLVEGCMRPIHWFGYCRECLTELNEALKRPLFQTTKGGMDV